MYLKKYNNYFTEKYKQSIFIFKNEKTTYLTLFRVFISHQPRILDNVTSLSYHLGNRVIAPWRFISFPSIREDYGGGEPVDVGDTRESDACDLMNN